jgi:hypothetical protein
MAEAQSPYVIIIKNQARTQKSPVANSSEKSEPKYTEGQLKAQGLIKALVAYDKYAAPFVENIVQRNVGTIELRTGAEELQQKVEFGLSIAKTAGGIITSALTGYAIGNLPGALIGTLISGVTTVMNYANRANTLRLEQNLEDIALRGMNVRAGGYMPTSIGSRSRTQ